MDETEKTAYRKLLQDLEQKAQETYDKAILSLSGGALGVSFAFIRDIVGPNPDHRGWLFLAWVSWGVSIAATLFSHYASAKALRRAVELVDKGQRPGPSQTTSFLNFAGGAFFLLGVILLGRFVWLNFGAMTDG